MLETFTHDSLASLEEGELTPAQRIERHVHSDCFVTRLYYIGCIGEVAVGAADTSGEVATSFIPLCHQLSRDPEPEIRQSAVEQIAPLIRALSADGSGRRPQVMELLEVSKRLLGDDIDEVKMAAEHSFLSLIQLSNEEGTAEWLLHAVVGSVLALARSQNRYDCGLRGPSVGILLRLAASLPSTLFEALVVPQLLSLAADPLITVRKALASGLPHCCKALSTDSDCVAETLLPLFSSLCMDASGDVREECAKGLVAMAQAVSAAGSGRRSVIIRAVKSLAADPSPQVKEYALRSLGPLLVESRDVPQELVDLFLGMMDTSQHLIPSFLAVGAHPGPPLESYQLEHIFAYSFPAVVSVVGRSRWWELDSAFAHLLRSTHVPVRRTVACYLHELARMLCASQEGEDTPEGERHEDRQGRRKPEIVVFSGRESGADSMDPLSRLMLAFDILIGDVDEVRMGMMEHFVDFVSFLPPHQALLCVESLPRALWHMGVIPIAPSTPPTSPPEIEPRTPPALEEIPLEPEWDREGASGGPKGAVEEKVKGSGVEHGAGERSWEGSGGGGPREESETMQVPGGVGGVGGVVAWHEAEEVATGGAGSGPWESVMLGEQETGTTRTGDTAEVTFQDCRGQSAAAEAGAESEPVVPGTGDEGKCEQVCEQVCEEANGKTHEQEKDGERSEEKELVREEGKEEERTEKEEGEGEERQVDKEWVMEESEGEKGEKEGVETEEADDNVDEEQEGEEDKMESERMGQGLGPAASTEEAMDLDKAEWLQQSRETQQDDAGAAGAMEVLAPPVDQPALPQPALHELPLVPAMAHGAGVPAVPADLVPASLLQPPPETEVQHSVVTYRETSDSPEGAAAEEGQGAGEADPVPELQELDKGKGTGGGDLDNLLSKLAVEESLKEVAESRARADQIQDEAQAEEPAVEEQQRNMRQQEEAEKRVQRVVVLEFLEPSDLKGTRGNTLRILDAARSKEGTGSKPHLTREDTPPPGLMGQLSQNALDPQSHVVPCAQAEISATPPPADPPRPARRVREQLRVGGPQSDWHLRQLVAQQAQGLAELNLSPEVQQSLVYILSSLCKDKVAAVREEAGLQLGRLLHLCTCPSTSLFTSCTRSTNGGAHPSLDDISQEHRTLEGVNTPQSPDSPLNGFKGRFVIQDAQGSGSDDSGQTAEETAQSESKHAAGGDSINATSRWGPEAEQLLALADGFAHSHNFRERQIFSWIVVGVTAAMCNSSSKAHSEALDQVSAACLAPCEESAASVDLGTSPLPVEVCPTPATGPAENRVAADAALEERTMVGGHGISPEDVAGVGCEPREPIQKPSSPEVQQREGPPITPAGSTEAATADCTGSSDEPATLEDMEHVHTQGVARFDVTGPEPDSCSGAGGRKGESTTAIPVEEMSAQDDRVPDQASGIGRPDLEEAVLGSRDVQDFSSQSEARGSAGAPEMLKGDWTQDALVPKERKGVGMSCSSEVLLNLLRPQLEVLAEDKTPNVSITSQKALLVLAGAVT